LQENVRKGTIFYKSHAILHRFRDAQAKSRGAWRRGKDIQITA
jgi:hypothetical protein